MDRRDLLKWGAAAAAIGAARAVAAEPWSGPALRFRADRQALLAELALAERIFAHEAPSPGEPNHPRLVLSPGASGCRILAASPASRYHSTIAAESHHAGAVETSLTDLLPWLAGCRASTLTVREVGPGRIEAKCADSAIRIPACRCEAPKPEFVPPSAHPVGAPHLAKLLHLASFNDPSTRLSIAEAAEHLRREAEDGPPTVYRFPVAGRPVEDEKEPSDRKRIILLRAETIPQAMVIARALDRPIRILEDGARVFVACGRRLLVASNSLSSPSTILESRFSVRNGDAGFEVFAVSPSD